MASSTHLALASPTLQVVGDDRGISTPYTISEKGLFFSRLGFVLLGSGREIIGVGR